MIGALHIGIAGPLATADIEHLLEPGQSHLPRAMQGASLLVSLIDEFLARGHRVSAFTVDPSLAPARDNIVRGHGDRFAVYYVPIRRHSFRSSEGVRGRMTDFYRLERQALERAMRTAAPDLLHAHWQYEYGMAALQSGVPALVTCHDAPWLVLRMMPNPYRLGRLLMAARVLRRARHVSAVSPYLQQAIGAMAARPVSLVPNPLPRAVTGERRDDGLRSTRPARVAMIVNGWGKRKNADRGMEALLLLQAALPATELHLIGPGFGPGEVAFEWAAERRASERFVFHGRLPYQRTIELLGTMQVLLHPALEESFGMTVAEAMSLGVPVVAGAEAGAVPWVTGGGSAGLLVDVRSPPAMCRAVRRLLDDEALYRACAEAGMTRARENFSAGAVADAYLSLYRQVLVDEGVAA